MEKLFKLIIEKQRERERQTDRQTDRQTERQRDLLSWEDLKLLTFIICTFKTTIYCIFQSVHAYFTYAYIRTCHTLRKIARHPP